MNRIVFQLGSAMAPDGMPFLSISLEEPPVFGSYAMPFTCQASDPASAAPRAAVVAQDSIKLAGGTLFTAVSAHPDVQQYLQTALQTAVGGRYPSTSRSPLRPGPRPSRGRHCAPQTTTTWLSTNGGRWPASSSPPPNLPPSTRWFRRCGSRRCCPASGSLLRVSWPRSGEPFGEAGTDSGAAAGHHQRRAAPQRPSGRDHGGHRA